MPLSQQQLQQISSAAFALPIDAPSERYEAFVGRILGLNPVQISTLLPSPDPLGLTATAIADLTKKREGALRRECKIPSFVVFSSQQDRTDISGLATHLSTRGNQDQLLLARIKEHANVRQALLAINKGHHLEAVSAAILNRLCKYGEATRGSGDQGIDGIGWNELILLDPVLSGEASEVGDKVFLFASSKASTGGTPRLMNPAHVRELVGGWMIQRSQSGKWQKQGVRPLSPLQMILCTTYRLSTDARCLCQELGIQVWALPELIYLITKSAPDPVFPPGSNYQFDAAQFESWWRARDTNRITA